MLVNAILGVTGLGNLGEGLSDLYNGEYKNAAKNLAEGSLRMILCAGVAIAAGEVFKKINVNPPEIVEPVVEIKLYDRVRDFCSNLKVYEETPIGSYSFDYPETDCINKMLVMSDETLELVKIQASADSVMNYCKNAFKAYDNSFSKVNLGYCMEHLFNVQKSGKTLVRLL